MDTLEEVLELLHGARGRFRTLEAGIRVWRDRRRLERARQDRLGEGARKSRGRKGRPSEERVDDLWFESPERWRLESDSGFIHIQNGDALYRHDPRDPSGSGRHQGLSFGDVPDQYRQLFWDPNILIPEMWLEPLDRVQVAEREGIRVLGRRRETNHGFMVGRTWWADKWELVVDLERGALLRVASRFEGEDVDVEEVLHIDFDRDLPDGVSSIAGRG